MVVDTKTTFIPNPDLRFEFQFDWILDIIANETLS